MSDRMAVYRPYDFADTLLYVGVTKNFGLRWQRQAELRSWWPQVTRMTVFFYDDEAAAVQAEQDAIDHEHPVHNVATTNRNYRRDRNPGRHRPQRYMGTAEIANELNVSRQRAGQLTAKPDFPDPFDILAAGKVWRRADIVNWAHRHGRMITDDDGAAVAS
jgi:hypothetical protein